MRKIENKMVNAINAAMNKGNDWELDNTRVVRCGNGSAYVYLHGHHIATVQNSHKGYDVEINLCGYNTRTTRSRLNAILSTYLPGVNGVATKQGQARIAYRDGTSRNIGSNEWMTARKD